MTTKIRTAEDMFADELIRQHLAGHITVRGIIGEAFRQGVMHEETKSAAMRDALKMLADCKLTGENCASFEVANKRIRHIARSALQKAGDQ